MQPITFIFHANECLENVIVCKLDENTPATDCIVLMQELQNVPSFLSQLKGHAIEELCSLGIKMRRGNRLFHSSEMITSSFPSLIFQYTFIFCERMESMDLPT